MPCINNTNGQPVPGRMGSCPIGSTWSAGDIPDLRLKKGEHPGFLDINNLKRKPMVDLKKRGLPNWAGDAGIIAAGVLGGGRNPGSKQAVLQSMKNMGTRLKDSKLMDKLFKSNKKQYNKDGSPKIVPGQPVYKNVRPNWNTKLKQWEFQGKKINPQKKVYNKDGTLKLNKDGTPVYRNSQGGVNSTKRVRVGTNPKLDARGNPIPVTARDWSKLKIGTGLALPGAAGIQALMNQFGGDAPVSKVDTDPSSPTYKGGREARAGRGPAPEQSQMQKAMANIKDPKFWMESMSDDPNDTRLMRIGQLMSHYGKPTERMRAQAGTPQEKWAENAARAKSSSSSYTALKNMILSPKELADAIYIEGGGAFGVQAWGGMDPDEKKAAAQKMGNAINALMHELAMAGQLPTWENARALFYARNPDKDPRNKEKKPEDEEPWYQFWN